MAEFPLVPALDLRLTYQILGCGSIPMPFLCIHSHETFFGSATTSNPADITSWGMLAGITPYPSLVAKAVHQEFKQTE